MYLTLEAITLLRLENEYFGTSEGTSYTSGEGFGTPISPDSINSGSGTGCEGYGEGSPEGSGHSRPRISEGFIGLDDGSGNGKAPSFMPDFVTPDQLHLEILARLVCLTYGNRDD